MKIAVVSESAADEGAVKILVDGILGIETDSFQPPTLTRRNNWHSAIKILPVVIRTLWFASDADALIVVVDSDDSPVHLNSHIPELAGSCRRCVIRKLIDYEIAQLPTRIGRRALLTAVGLAVPSIEAWYRCIFDPHVNEATWNRKLLHDEAITFDRRTLKRDVYGTPLMVDASKAKAAAERLRTEIPLIEQLFPGGFGSLVRDIRNW